MMSSEKCDKSEFGYFYAFMSSAVSKNENGIALHLFSPDSHIKISLTFPVLPKPVFNYI